MHCTSQALGIKKEALSTLKAAAVWFSRARARWFLQLEPTSYGDSLRMILMLVMTMAPPASGSDASGSAAGHSFSSVSIPSAFFTRSMWALG